VSDPQTAVVLVNLGTPASPRLEDVRAYLREFLSDKRVVRLPGAVWQPILRLGVLRRHAPKSAEMYASVWTEAGSPLLVNARAQAAALQVGLGGTRVAYAMRYGQPSLAEVLDALRGEGYADVLLVPMYPQYSTTTVASVEDALLAYPSWSALPPDGQFRVDVLEAFHDDPGYISACVAQIRRFWAERGQPDFHHGDKLLLSFHGIPAALVAAGDPYQDQCERTAELIREGLDLRAGECWLTYQSRFGKGKWLEPTTLDAVRSLGEAGARRVDVFCPGFVCDCVETIDEIGRVNKDAFLVAGGHELCRIDCLNDSPEWIGALARLVGEHLLAG
jgi:ferrochelatase